jgi:hypothetical protein
MNSWTERGTAPGVLCTSSAIGVILSGKPTGGQVANRENGKYDLDHVDAEPERAPVQDV